MFVKYLCIFLLFISFSKLTFAQSYDETGLCTYYAYKFHGQSTASGEKYDKDLFSAAHRSLPFNTLLRVTNIKNNKSVIVRVNDRGPTSKKLLIDLSIAAASAIDMLAAGVMTVRIEYAGMADADSVKNILLQRNSETAKSKEKTNAVLKQNETEEFIGIKGSVYYNQEFKDCKPKGYGVQLGYFKNLSNCRNNMHIYESRYNVVTFMYTEIKNNSTYYSLIMGQFGSKVSAETFRDYIKKDIPDCFVISYTSY